MPSIMQHMLSLVKPGDKVTRMLAGTIPMELNVTEVTETEILCGHRDEGYKFDRKTGVEIDEDIPMVVSYLLLPMSVLDTPEVPETKNEHVQSATQ